LVTANPQPNRRGIKVRGRSDSKQVIPNGPIKEVVASEPVTERLGPRSSCEASLSIASDSQISQSCCHDSDRTRGYRWCFQTERLVADRVEKCAFAPGVSANKDDAPKSSKAREITHPGMMGDGTEEQNLGEAGIAKSRIKKDEVEAAFEKTNLKRSTLNYPSSRMGT
jgi:hypothetical protein